MAKYAVSNGTGGTPQAMTTTYKTVLDLTAATGATTLRYAWIYDVMFGTDGTPADNAMRYKIDRQTTTGTRTTAVPAPLDAAIVVAALITAGANTTIEGIVTAATQLLEVGVNQRASYRWVAAPGGEFVVPAINVTGIGIRANSPAYTGTALCSCNFWE
jgi:hypothetical protein